jgi:hypothetical protein
VARIRLGWHASLWQWWRSKRAELLRPNMPSISDLFHGFFISSLRLLLLDVLKLVAHFIKLLCRERRLQAGNTIVSSNAA